MRAFTLSKVSCPLNPADLGVMVPSIVARGPGLLHPKTNEKPTRSSGQTWHGEMVGGSQALMGNENRRG